jgi:deoxycytidine triphosphate deaminase
MMMVLNDKQIAKRAAQGMIEPFVDKQVREVVVESNYEGKLASTTGKKRIKVVSYGLSSFGYDIRIGTKFKVFSNAYGCPVIDPKNFEPKVLVEIEVEPHEAVIIPPNSYVLGLSLEYFRIPNDIIALCHGKSTLVRSGILVNVTPFEPCYSADTECLTIEGWKLLKDVKIGEQIATLNDKSELEYHPVERKQEYDYDGDMIHFAGRSIDLLVTPEHKVYAKNRYHDRYELIEARDIYKRYNWKMKRDAEWTGLRRETVEVAGETVDTDLWLQFLGYWIGDGSVTFNSKKKHYQIRLACFKDRKVKKYGKVLEKLPFKFSRIGTGYSCLNKALYEELVEFAGCENKRVPDWVMSLDASHLDVLLDALIESDGNRGTMTYKTASKQLADQLQEIALKTGRVAIIRRLDAETQNTQSNGDIKATRTSYVLRFCSGQTEPKVSPATQHKVHYTGKVYDVTVKNHVLYVRRNGKPVWSGNCWVGHAVLEISNMTPLPAKVYAGEGIAQVLFLKGEPPATTYADRQGRYQDQRDIVTSRV